MSERRKRLIEVAFPLKEVSAHSGHEKKVHHGHISTLHTWWARRPLAACRAFIYASLVDDPETEAEREALLREVADLAAWSAVRHPDDVVRAKEQGGSGLTGTELLERARERILADNGGEAPSLLDPFAGGGAIPLEGLRLGCEVEASDLNPVAVLILKGTLEYPQKYGQPDSRPVPDYIREADATDQASLGDGELATEYRRNPLAADVRYWGNWMLERAREELADFYPPDPDGSVPVAYLWSRTIPCPSCHAEMPLIRQYWLARKDKKKVALEPVIDREAGRVEFRIVEGEGVTGRPEQATTSRGDTRCLLCDQVVKAAQVQQAGIDGKMSATMTAVVLTKEGERGKRYREGTARDMDVFTTAVEQLAEVESTHEGDLALIPDEPLAYHPQYMQVRGYGLTEWGKLFNDRQLLALTTFVRLVGEAHAEMRAQGFDEEYAKAVGTYLGLSVSRYSSSGCSLALWYVDAEVVVRALGRQALSMVWDYGEHAATDTEGGSFVAMVDRVATALETAIVDIRSANVTQANSRFIEKIEFSFILTDPPYYDSINYADLSDFWYVWMKRSMSLLHPEIFSLPLTPKGEQIVMNMYANIEQGKGHDREGARKHYIEGMADSFRAMWGALDADGLAGVVFAHTDPDAWSTLIESLLQAGFIPHASWPIDTESQSGMVKIGQARLKTSVWMACRKRAGDAGEAFLGDVLEEMRPVIRERLLFFWGQGIRGADFFISAIGPALSVFGRHERVLRPDGAQVTVREFLDIVRRESTDVALEQVLRGADLGVVDAITRQYVTWVWSYSRASLDAGEALALCLATGAPYEDLTRERSIAADTKSGSKKVVKLRTIAERAREDDDLGEGTAARPAPLIEELQRAAWLWGQNQSARLGEYRGALGESRWAALQTLGQAVAECLPDGDEDRRIILGLLGATVRGVEPPQPDPQLGLAMEGNDGAD